MSRTPLFRLIRRSLRLAQASLHQDEPLDEMLDRVEVARRLRHANTLAHANAHANAGTRTDTLATTRSTISRRQFLVGISAATATLALDGCGIPGRGRVATLPTHRDDRDTVLIIGAGIAGLTAAYRLRQQGVRVRIIEAQDRVGGRMFSLRNTFADGQVCELGGELIDTGHERIRALSQELGIVLDDLHALEDPTVATDVWHFGGMRRSQEEIIRALVPVVQRLELERAGWGDEFDPTYKNTFGVEELDRMTLAEWLDGVGVSGWIRDLLDVGYTTEYGLPIDQQSALNFVTMIEASNSDFKIYGESDERFRVHRGNDLITSTLAEKLDDAIETGAVLEAVAQRSDGTFRCSIRRNSASQTIEAQRVVLAIPFTTLRDVQLDIPLPDVKRRAIQELGYGANAKLMIGFNERVWRTRHQSNGSVLTSLPFQLTWETSRGQSGNSGILTNFTGGAQAISVGQGSAESQAQKLVPELDQIFSGAQAAHSGMKSVRFHWPSFPWTKGSYASYRPSQWTSIRGAEGESVGQLYFAGEHCSLSAQGFMEGGCETGEQAAITILQSLGKQTSAP